MLNFEGTEEIVFDVQKQRIIFNKVDLFDLPASIKSKPRIYTMANILSKSGVVLTQEQMTSFANAAYFEQFYEIEALFNVRLQVWSMSFDSSKNLHQYKHLYRGNRKNKQTILLHHQRETNLFLLIEDSKRYFAHYFPCKNKEKGCHYTFRTAALRTHHEIRCGEENMKIIQTEFAQANKLLDKAVNQSIVERLDSKKDFLFFDIESVLPPSNVQTAKSRVLSSHTLVSIAANRFLFDYYLQISIC